VELQDATAAERGTGTCLVRNPGLATRCAEPCSVWGNEGIDICSIPPISRFSVESCVVIIDEWDGQDQQHNNISTRKELILQLLCSNWTWVD
jgi:hypothetical protein